MPIDVTYATRYTVDTLTSELSSASTPASVTFQVTSPDDEIAVGGSVTVTVFNNGTEADSFTAEYLGISVTGEILLLNTSNATTLLLTNDTGLSSGDPLPTISTDPLVCFAEGTLIATARGDVAVEDLKAGDTVLTADGKTAPVRWVGHQTRSTVFSDAARVCPIRIAAGALAENVPSRDLLVTGDHGIVFDEAIVHASALVNGTTITRVAKSDLGQTVTYFHVETEGHAVILAEGCPAETFIDNVSRELFDNYAEFVTEFGADQNDIEPLGLPRAKGPRQVPAAIKARIADRMVALTGPVAEAV